MVLGVPILKHFRVSLQMFKRNLKTKPSDEEEVAEERLELEATEITREEDRSAIGMLSFFSFSLCRAELQIKCDFRII